MQDLNMGVSPKVLGSYVYATALMHGLEAGQLALNVGNRKIAFLVLSNGILCENAIY